MNSYLAREAKSRPMVYPAGRPRQLQSKCACGKEMRAGGECEECKKKREAAMQGYAADSAISATVPAIVNDVLRSSGQALDPATRAFMEPRFGHDFGSVRIHSDDKAAESARAVDSLAYTFGKEIVFGSGQYTPGTTEGRKLIAHELTHVVQQSIPAGPQVVPGASGVESEALRSSSEIAAGRRASARIPTATGIQRQKDPNPLDDKAKAIIANAKDTSKPIGDRAKQAVGDILQAYWVASKVSEVVYDEKEPGLSTTPVGTGAALKGQITVGKYFIEHIDSFARRVVQVGHELEHIDQQRGGMGGAANKDKREFLAFAWEAQTPERTGTGRMSYAMRRDLIDSALGYYNCLSAEDQKSFAGDRDKLLKLREEVNGKGGNPPTAPPTDCKRQ
jgi:hypothetical protein